MSKMWMDLLSYTLFHHTLAGSRWSCNLREPVPANPLRPRLEMGKTPTDLPSASCVRIASFWTERTIWMLSNILWSWLGSSCWKFVEMWCDKMSLQARQHFWRRSVGQRIVQLYVLKLWKYWPNMHMNQGGVQSPTFIESKAPTF